MSDRSNSLITSPMLDAKRGVGEGGGGSIGSVAGGLEFIEIDISGGDISEKKNIDICCKLLIVKLFGI